MRRIISSSAGACMHDLSAHHLCCALALLLLLFTCGFAQSGRAPKRSPAATPSPQSSTTSSPPIEEPPDASSAAHKKPATRALFLRAVKYIPSANVTVETNIAFKGFIERLREIAGVDVLVSSEGTRKQAMDLAKAEKDAYVLWMQLELDVADTESANASIGPINPGCLLVSYHVYAPQTGKVKTQGRVYQPGYQSRCVGSPLHPSPFPDTRGQKRLPIEYTLQQAGREAANRLAQAFGLIS